eukprot:EG_transcript_12264
MPCGPAPPSEAELQLLSLDLRASQARKLVAALAAHRLTLADLRHWPPTVARPFLRAAFPALPDRKLTSLLRRLQPLLSPNAPSPPATAAAPAGAAARLPNGPDPHPGGPPAAPDAAGVPPSAIDVGFGQRLPPPAGDGATLSPNSGSKAYKHREMIDQANRMVEAAPCQPPAQPPAPIHVGVGANGATAPPKQAGDRCAPPPPAPAPPLPGGSVSLSEALQEATLSQEAWESIIQEGLLGDPPTAGSPRFLNPMADLSRQLSPPCAKSPRPATPEVPSEAADPVPAAPGPTCRVLACQRQTVKAREACRPRRYCTLLAEQGQHLQQLQDADDKYRQNLQTFFDNQERLQAGAMDVALEAPPWDLVFGLTMFAALHSAAADSVA